MGFISIMLAASDSVQAASLHISGHIAHLRQQRHISKSVILQDKLLKVWSAIIFYECNEDTTALQRRVFANCVMTLQLLKVRLQTCLSIPLTQKCQIFSCDTLVANEWYGKNTPSVLFGSSVTNDCFTRRNVLGFGPVKFLYEENKCSGDILTYK